MKKNSIWLLLVFILAGIVVGSLLGELAQDVSWLWWLNFGETFGLEEPISLDLSVLKIVFGITFKLSISSIIGMFAAIMLYRVIK